MKMKHCLWSAHQSPPSVCLRILPLNMNHIHQLGLALVIVLVPGFPNRSVFSGKGPDPDLFVLQGPENGPDFTEKSGFLS